jgi:hypothetical protein
VFGVHYFHGGVIVEIFFFHNFGMGVNVGVLFVSWG